MHHRHRRSPQESSPNPSGVASLGRDIMLRFACFAALPLFVSFVIFVSVVIIKPQVARLRLVVDHAAFQRSNREMAYIRRSAAAFCARRRWLLFLGAVVGFGATLLIMEPVGWLAVGIGYWVCVSLGFMVDIILTAAGGADSLARPLLSHADALELARRFSAETVASPAAISENAADVCSLCLDPLWHPGDAILSSSVGAMQSPLAVSRAVPCGHLFHKHCIEQMVVHITTQRDGGLSLSCPLCRQAMIAPVAPDAVVEVVAEPVR